MKHEGSGHNSCAWTKVGKQWSMERAAARPTARSIWQRSAEGIRFQCFADFVERAFKAIVSFVGHVVGKRIRYSHISLERKAKQKFSLVLNELLAIRIPS